MEDDCSILNSHHKRNIYQRNILLISQPVRKCWPNLEIFMPLTVVLAVGLDTANLESQISDWRSAGLRITPAWSVRDAIVLFKDGDFDLVLLGRSIPADSRERLTFLIRSTGSRVPVVCIADSSGDCDNFVDATINDDPIKFLDGITRIMADRATTCASSLTAPSSSM